MTNKLRNYITESEADWKKYENMLKNHDWFYSMSDDNRYYVKGKKEMDDINNMEKQLSNVDADKARFLHLKYAKMNTGLSTEAEIEFNKLKKKF